MPRFRYTAKDVKGGTIRALDDAASARALAGALRRRGLIVISIEEAGGAGKPLEKTDVKIRQAGKIKVGEIADFFRQMATLIDAGIPLVAALDILVDREENALFKKVLEDIKGSVEAGVSFSASLDKFPDIFATYTTAMVQAGEEGGGMANILEKLATYLEDVAEMQQKLKSASAYPVFILSFFVLAMIGVMFFLIPMFEKIFASFNMTLPLPTRILMGISKFLSDYVAFEIGAVVVAVIFYKTWSKTAAGKYKMDQIVLRLPVMGKVLQKSIIARFCQTFGILLESGVTVVNALAIAEKTAGNLIYEEGIGTIRSGIMGGETIGKEMGRTGLFPKMLVSMISTGEQSGTLGPMLSKAARTYKREVESAVAGATALIEPVMMVGLGVIISITVLAIYLPIFQIGGGGGKKH